MLHLNMKWLKIAGDFVPCQLVQAGTIRFLSNVWLWAWMWFRGNSSREYGSWINDHRNIFYSIYWSLNGDQKLPVQLFFADHVVQSSFVCVYPCLCVCEASHVWVVDIHHWALNDSSSPPPCFALLTLLTHQERNKHTHSAKVSRLTAVGCWMIITEQSS